jgi:hypothetical protein
LIEFDGSEFLGIRWNLMEVSFWEFDGNEFLGM